MPDPLVQPEEGDVLLSAGTKAVSRLIMAIDRAPVSHSSVWVGGGDVVEAVAPRVVRRPLLEASAHADRVVARRLDRPGLALDPVVQRALAFAREGRRYGYEQVVLLTFLGISRRLEGSPALKALLRGALDGAAGWLLGLVHDGRAPLICSELVFRSFAEARARPSDPPGRYALTIDLASPRGRPLRAGGRGPARVRGVETGSLLDLVAGARAPAALRRAPPPARLTAEDAEALVEPLARAHLEALAARGRGRSLSATGLRPEDTLDLLPSVRAFASAWAAAAPLVAGPPRSPRVKQAAPPPPLAALRRVVAQFVTPGDLFFTRSLWTVGDVKRPA